MRRVTRSPAGISRTQSSQSIGNNQTSTNKTKCALCFLCLFDGLRTPSIRRLIRKPRTVCNKPILTFDPSCSSPSTEECFETVYRTLFNCKSYVSVDPSVQTVLAKLRQYTNSIPPHRVLIHYFGQGCHAPTTDGCLYFFSEDRARYKPLKMLNFLNTCSCPLAFIFDCPSAASLMNQVKNKKDIFAFFATGINEALPLSTHTPADLFSFCMLSPYEAAIWWRLHRVHSSVYTVPREPSEENVGFLQSFLFALLDAIAFETQSSIVYDVFNEDPTISQLFKGFLLGKRIMSSYNIHSQSLPELNPTNSHQLWCVWEFAIDLSLTLMPSQIEPLVFNICCESMNTYPSSVIFPMLSFFINKQAFREKAADIIWKYIDSVPESAEIAARSVLPKVIMQLDKPSYKCLLVIAKIFSAKKIINIDPQITFSFLMLHDPNSLYSAMIALSCLINKTFLSSGVKLTHILIDNAEECAPYSALLLGSIVGKGGPLMQIRGYTEKFLPLLSNERPDSRATTVYLLGYADPLEVLSPIKSLSNDPDPYVREQVMHSLILLASNNKDRSIIDSIEPFSKDENENVRISYKNAEANISRIKQGGQISQSTNNILNDFVQSVYSINFKDRMDTNIFDIPLNRENVNGSILNK